MPSKSKTNVILLIIILLSGFILRFYHFFQLPFTWDELSAWNRIHFNSFSDLIALGVKPDGHPAGVQVFLYYWISFFGDREWVVKLPFAIMGISSVYVFYEISKIWWNKSAGLINAAFMASLQFFVLYSTIARPYISGLFLSLMAVYFWSLYMFENHRRRHLFGFIIFAALSAYNHHFSLLFVAIVGLSGIFIIPKHKFKEYIIAGILIFILYTPHLPIFIHQLGVGGIGGEGNWLSKPEPDFIYTFLYWCFHFSPLVIAIIVLITAFSFIAKNTDSTKQWQKRILLLNWFFLPIIIGYYYSVKINPVIQYSMLIFSFPYFLLLISSNIKSIKPLFITPIIIVILLINSYTLIYDRHHFEIIEKQPFNTSAECLTSQKDINSNDIFLIYNTIDSYQEYYLKKFDIPNTSKYNLYDKNLSLSQFDEVLRNIKQDHILLSSLPESFVSLARYYFPNLIQRTNAYTSESYLLSKTLASKETFHQIANENNFSDRKENWNFSPERIYTDSLNHHYYTYNNQQEWGLGFTDSLSNILNRYGGILDIEVDIISTQEPTAVLATTFTADSTVNIWRGQEFKGNLIATAFGYRLYYSIDTRILMKETTYNDINFKLHLWNKGKEAFMIK
ncbi:MAG: glycosyltransferase family 39 protein, partial [Bacteroidales bacterium]|nr:glycosyltransferase family 39 protein [Bacteroidales bacterium]